MKHLLNDLSEKEKNSIREQHTGGIKIVNENFSKLINATLGDSKPLVNEQNEYTVKRIQGLVADGYKETSQINLPDGVYQMGGSGYQVNIMSPKDENVFTGYIILTENGIRGLWKGPINITNKQANGGPAIYKIFFKESGYKPSDNSDIVNKETITTKVASEGLKNVTTEMISSPPFKGVYGGFQFGGVFKGIDYKWDCKGVEGFGGVRSMEDGQIISETIENMISSLKLQLTDIQPNSPSVGFYGEYSKFIIYLSKDGKVKYLPLK
jgi:hypothetical protein